MAFIPCQAYLSSWLHVDLQNMDKTKTTVFQGLTIMTISRRVKRGDLHEISERRVADMTNQIWLFDRL